MKQIKLTKANLEKLVANPPSQRDEYRTDIGGCYLRVGPSSMSISVLRRDSKLDLRLTRDGVLESISVVESSGDATFDRSAISAVERVGKFEKIDELSTEDFERYFQYFRLRFKPEDLRY